jgi:hypothetical protein
VVFARPFTNRMAANVTKRFENLSFKLGQPVRLLEGAAMGTLVIRHKVKDYSKWRLWFDQHAPAQKSAGLTNPRVFRSSDDKNEVVIMFDADDTKRVEDFVASPCPTRIAYDNSEFT